MSGDALPDIQALDLMFKPEMGEMSSLALPENLPLDFIASEFPSSIHARVYCLCLLRTHSAMMLCCRVDIQFQAQDLPSIAPSAVKHKPDYSLPQITDGGIPMEAGPPPAAPAAPAAATPAAEAAGAPPPPPPPPPPPGAPQPAHTQARAPPPPPPPPVNLAPPPPPPAPPVAPTAAQQQRQQEAAESNDENLPPSSAPAGRGNLLDAIKVCTEYTP